MKLLFWIIAILFFLWLMWVFVLPPIAARITMSKSLARVAMPGLRDRQPEIENINEEVAEADYVTLPSGARVPRDVAQRLFPTLFVDSEKPA